VAPDVPDQLVGDWGRLRQVLVNLANNAVKFTQRGEVIVQVTRQEDGDLAADRRKSVHLHFAVRDTGIGIPAGHLTRIFEPFHQAEGSTARRFGGTGLGLTISARLADLMGGKIWVDSETGRGSTFHFTLRLASAVKSDRPDLPAQPPGLEGLRVLVVDDNATNRTILQEILLTWRMNPVVADSGPTALSCLRQAADRGEPFALVLLDALMPAMDGFTLAEQVQQQPELAAAIIMMLSSAHPPRDVARCRRLGVPRYLTKPIKQSDLLNAILSVVAAPADQSAIEATKAREEKSPDSRRRRFRILLAEDNIVNQKLVVSLLAKQGCDVFLAQSGKEALAAFDRDPFDLVLMDVEMPEMDGLEATRRIRQHEAHTGRHVPIVAMTAHAMKGDRERCLDTGMDGYLAKPIRASELVRVLIQFQLARAEVDDTLRHSPRPSPPPHADNGEREILDADAILVRVDHDVQLLKILVESFLAECPKLLADVRSAINHSDARQLRVAAHTLKGAVSNFSTWEAFEAALRLESIAGSANLTPAADACTALEEALNRLLPALSGLISAK
jgi:CheY-like chemotaxis protein